jgi:hypothetical protein
MPGEEVIPSEKEDFFSTLGKERKRSEKEDKPTPQSKLGQSSREINIDYWRGGKTPEGLSTFFE